MRKLKPLVADSFTRDIDWIRQNISVRHDTGCWEWLRSTSSGYGQFSHVLKSRKVRSYRVHRYVYRMCVENIGSEFLVRHMCHNKLCCNPDHLKKGNSLDNYNDSIEEYTACHVRSKGKRANNALVSDFRAALYRKLFSSGILTLDDIMKESGVKEHVIRDLLRGRTYKRKGLKYVPDCIARLNSTRVGRTTRPVVLTDSTQTKETLKLIFKLRSEGKSDYKISEITGVPRPTVYRWRIENNIA